MTSTISKLPPQAIPDIAELPARALQPGESGTLAGRRATLVLSPAERYTLLINGQPLIRQLDVFDLAESGVRQTPLFLERALSNALVERAFVPLRHGAAAWHWHASRELTVRVHWEWAGTVPAAGSSAGWFLQVGNVAFLCDRAVDWFWDARSALLSAPLRPDEALTLVAADLSGDAHTSLRAIQNLAALVHSRAADWSRAQLQMVQVKCSDAGWADRVNTGVYLLHSSGTSFENVRSTAPAAVGLEDAAATVSMLLELLGVAPDPEKHRVQLAPCLPAEWTHLEVLNLPIGDAGAFALDYQRSGGTHTFVLAPSAGAVPPRLIFEPAIPASNVSSVTVDGIRADLNIRHAGARVVCPVQVVLDHPRTIVITAD